MNFVTPGYGEAGPTDEDISLQSIYQQVRGIQHQMGENREHLNQWIYSLTHHVDDQIAFLRSMIGDAFHNLSLGHPQPNA